MTRRIVSLLIAILAGTSAASAHVVDVLEDGHDAVRDGACATAQGHCTLRAALEEGGPAQLGPGVHVLNLGPLSGGGFIQGSGRDVTVIQPDVDSAAFEAVLDSRHVPRPTSVALADVTFLGQLRLPAGSITLTRVTMRGAETAHSGSIHATDSRFERDGLSTSAFDGYSPPSLIVNRCTFVDCAVGVSLEGSASVDAATPATVRIADSSFVDCGVGVSLVDGLTASVERVSVRGGGTALSVSAACGEPRAQPGVLVTDLVVDGAGLGVGFSGGSLRISRGVFRRCATGLDASPGERGWLSADECLIERCDVGLASGPPSESGGVSLRGSSILGCRQAVRLRGRHESKASVRLEGCTITDWDGR